MNKDDATWLKISYLCFGILVAFVMWKAMETLGVQTGWGERYGDSFPIVSTAVSIAVGALSVFALNRSQERHDYFIAAIAELRKVTWPSFIDTRRMTIVVCIVVGIFAVIVAVFDLFWAKMLKMLLA